MGGFSTPRELTFNRGLITDPASFARDAGAASWLYLCGEEFAAMPEGMSYEDVRSAVPESANIPVDTIPLDMEIAKKQIDELDRLPRPTLVTCRTGPKSSALVYLYAGLEAGAAPDEVLAQADADGAPFAGAEPLRAWVAKGLTELRRFRA